MYRSKRISFVIALTLLALLPAAPAQAANRRLAENKKQIARARAQIATAQRTDAEVLAALRDINRNLSKQQRSLASARAHLARIDRSITSQERQLNDLGRQRAIRSKAIRARATALYIMGPVGGLEALNRSKTIGDFVRRASALEFVSTFDRTVLQDLASLRHDIKLTRASLARQRVEAAETRNEIAERVALVSGWADNKKRAHARIQAQIQHHKDEIAALQREQKRILGIFRSRGSVWTGGESRLGYVWPFRGKITSGYGRRWGRQHTGIDIDCRTGDTIVASKEGRVIASEYGGGYGQMVIVDHGGGYATLYAHLSRRFVSEGTRVSQRQSLGACGSTGNSTGDHLHFEVRVGGEPRNPMNYLP
jgi:murein DD-endopeptidase MepM/ murein hydrolase activator NlpD